MTLFFADMFPEGVKLESFWTTMLDLILKSVSVSVSSGLVVTRCCALTPPELPATIAPIPFVGLSVLEYGLMNLERFFLAATGFLAEAPGAPSYSIETLRLWATPGEFIYFLF